MLGPKAEQLQMLSSRRAAFVVPALTLFMFSIDTTVVTIAFSDIEAGLNTSFIWAVWTFTSFQLVNTISMPLLGRISDDFGRKKLYLICLSLFTLGALAAGLAPNITILIICRIFMGIAAGAFQPSAVGFISDNFPEKRIQVIGLTQAMFPVGGVLGPICIGLLLQSDLFGWGWRWAFFINVPTGLLALLIGILFLKDKPVSKGHRLDMSGAVYFGMAIMTFMLAFTFMGLRARGEADIPWSVIALLTGWSFCSVALFVRREARAPEPIFNLQLLRYRPFLAANIYNFFMGASHFGLFSFIPRFAIIGYGMNQIEKSIILLPRTIPMLVFSVLSSLLIVPKIGFRIPLILGLLLVGSGLLFLSAGWGTEGHRVAFLSMTLPGFFLLGYPLAFTGLGMGIQGVAATNVALDLMPKRVAEITGLRGMFRNTGAVVGVTLTLYFASLFEDEVTGFLWVFLILGIMTIALVPTIFQMPDRPSPSKGLATPVAPGAATGGGTKGT